MFVWILMSVAVLHRVGSASVIGPRATAGGADVIGAEKATQSHVANATKSDNAKQSHVANATTEDTEKFSHAVNATEAERARQSHVTNAIEADEAGQKHAENATEPDTTIQSHAANATEADKAKRNYAVNVTEADRTRPWRTLSGRRLMYGYGESNRNNDADPRAECGPVPFPELSCEDKSVLRDTPPLEIISPTTTTSYFEATTTGDRTTATKSRKFAEKKLKSSAFLRLPIDDGQPSLKPIYKLVKFRQLVMEDKHTSSTRSLGWRSTPPDNMPMGCNKLAKCENQVWDE